MIRTFVCHRTASLAPHRITSAHHQRFRSIVRSWPQLTTASHSITNPHYHPSTCPSFPSFIRSDLNSARLQAWLISTSCSHSPASLPYIDEFKSASPPAPDSCTHSHSIDLASLIAARPNNRPFYHRDQSNFRHHGNFYAIRSRVDA